MGWKAKYMRREGTQAVFFTRAKGEFMVDVSADAWPMVESLPDGTMVEVDTQNYKIANIKQLEDTPQRAGSNYSGPRRAPSGGGGSNPETDFKISFYASAKAISTLRAGSDITVAQLALESLALMDQCGSLMAQKLAGPPPGQPASSYNPAVAGHAAPPPPRREPPPPSEEIPF